MNAGSTVTTLSGVMVDQAALLGVASDAYAAMAPGGRLELGRLATGTRTETLQRASRLLTEPLREGHYEVRFAGDAAELEVVTAAGITRVARAIDSALNRSCTAICPAAPNWRNNRGSASNSSSVSARALLWRRSRWNRPAERNASSR